MRMMKTVLYALAVGCSLDALSAGAQTAPVDGAGTLPAATQTPAADSPQEAGAIVVTALKRETLLERTPIAISVVTGDALTARGVTEIADLRASVPSLTLAESPGGLTGISLRGVGTSASSQAFEQSVGLFLDGIYHPRARQYRDALFDVEQVEVIKGAQGVLFGKNTSVGAISVRTRSPRYRLGGNLQGSYETEFDSYAVQGGIDLPVAANAAFRIAGLYEDEGGYVRNVVRGRDEPATERLTGRLSFRADPTSDLSVAIKAQGGRLRIRGDAFDWVDVTNRAALIAAGVADGGDRLFEKYDDSGRLGDSFDRQDSLDLSANVAWDLGGITLTSLTGYSWYRYRNGFDSDTSPLPLIHQQFNERFDQFTQELRVATDGTGPLQVTAGVFYLDQNDRFDIVTQFLAFRGVLTGSRRQVFAQGEQTYSAFGQAIWDATDALHVTAGARFSHDRKRGAYAKTIGPVGTTPASGAFPFYAPPGATAATLTDDSFDYTVTLSYDLTGRAVAYASVGRGTKSGGFNNNALAGVLLPNPFSVAPEEATTYELGVKGRFLGNRVYAAVSAFAIDIDAFQDSYYDPTRTGFIIRSLDAKTRGVEGELRANPTDWLTLYGNLAWLPRARLDTGERMQRAPRFTNLAGAQVTAPLGGDLALTVSGEWNHSTSYLNQAPSAPGSNGSGAFDLFSARAALALPAAWEVFVAGANLSNERYKEFSFAGTLGAGTVGVINRPRTVTLGVRKTF